MARFFKSTNNRYAHEIDRRESVALQASSMEESGYHQEEKQRTTRPPPSPTHVTSGLQPPCTSGPTACTEGYAKNGTLSIFLETQKHQARRNPPQKAWLDAPPFSTGHRSPNRAGAAEPALPQPFTAHNPKTMASQLLENLNPKY